MKNRKPLAILFVTLLLDMIGIGMILPIIPIIFTDPTSPSFLLAAYSKEYWYIIAGLATALWGLMQFIASPILGELSDMYGRKRLLAIGVGVLALSQFLFGFSIEINSLGLLLFSRFIGGIAGANFSIVQAAIVDVSKPEDRAKNFGLIGAAFGLGTILGPFMSGYITSFTGNASSSFFLAGVLGIINLLSVMFFLPETHHTRSEIKKLTLWRGIHNIRLAFTDKVLLPMYTATFLYFTGFAFLTSFTGLLLSAKLSFNETQLGTYYAILGVWMIIGQIVILRIVTKYYKEVPILRVNMILLALALIVLPFMPSPLFAYLWIPFIAIPHGLCMANLTSYISNKVPKENQGVSLGVRSSLMALSQGVVPLLAGVISAGLGIMVPHIIGGLCVFAAWFILFGTKARNNSHN